MRIKGEYMAKSYVKFEVSNDVVSKTYEALQMVKQSGKVREGATEVTKSVEQGLATFVVIAGRRRAGGGGGPHPEALRGEEDSLFIVPSKLELGKSIGLNVPCTAVAVESAGAAQHNINDIIPR